ncbi:flocculation protein FLO11-like isoform X1 [Amphibalanus amphitrite]|uniref:flocculation protein FLO11-like isoform X1 n=1 Tax=Amphibalanus amphitrite TaxID=1232801 RepID=UPI001C913020|nr:flocculation protein FLO11-like isoform X1 [Amphibalanus amphitrite]
MLRCFDCNATAADAVQLVQDGSWMGPTPSRAADTQEPVTTQKRSALNTEYKLKFRPFSDYTYVDGHFTGARDATDGGGEADRSSAAAGAAGAPPTPWYEEVVELRRKASSYKVRGWGKEMAQPHMAHLYDKEEDSGHLAERKIISALYLETLKPGFVREERGRSPVTTGGASVRQQSHPPPSSRKSPGAAKMALKLHAAEGSKRPHSAQPSTDRHTGDVVDRPKGRSPATPRTPTSRPDGVPSAAAKPRKRPTERPPSVDKAEKAAAAARPPATRPPPAAAAAARPEKKVDRPSRPPPEKPEKKAEKPPRPATAKTERSSRPPPAAAAPSGTPDSASGKGIRGGTPRSRSAHRLAAKAKSPTKAERPLSTAMTASAPAGSAEEAVKPTPEQDGRVDEEKKPAVEAAETAAAPVPQPPAAPAAVESAAPQVDMAPPTDAAPEEQKSASEEVVRSVPEPTRVKSPEGMAPIKSPEPVNWTVPLDTGKTFTVTQNVMGGHGSPMSSRADSLRSPTEDAVRSPLARGVTDVSHLRNGEPAPPPVESPLTNDLPATNGRGETNHEPDEELMSGSFHADVGYGGEVRKAPQDPMSASMAGEDLKRSLMAEDPMATSMTGEDLERSLHDPMAMSMTAEDLKGPQHDPMTASMTGDDLKRSLHDPMTSSMTGDELQRSFHADEPASDAAVTGSFRAQPPPPPVPAPRPTPAPAQRVLDDPLMAAATFSRPAEPPAFSERPAASSLFSSGSAGPPRFSHELFGSSGRPAEQKPDTTEKPLYRVI